jgi:two-component system sensor histidine kinase UhpB
MNLKLSLEARLNLTIACVMLCLIALGFAWTIRDARDSVRLEAQASVSLALGLMDATLSVQDMHSGAIHAWVEKIRHLDRIRHLSIEVIPGERVKSPEDRRGPDNVDRHVPRWFRLAVISPPVRVVREVSLGQEPPVSIRIESLAEDEILEAWEEARGFLLLQGFLLMAIYLSVHLIAGRALRPVARILQGLNAMEKGDYDTRLPRFGLTELDRISSGINHLSSSLKASRDENRALTRHSLAIQEVERRTLAQEIHDEFGQNLTAIKMMTMVVGSHSHVSSQQATEEIQRLCDRLFDVVRSMMRRLRPMVLEDLGLNAALSDLKDHWLLSNPDLQMVIQCDPALMELKGELSLEIYRIVQEALTNTHRHAQASYVWVQIEVTPSQMISLVVKDNGNGMTQSQESKGFGLIGMRERVASLQGHFKLVSEPRKGLEIRVLLPGDVVNGG